MRVDISIPLVSVSPPFPGGVATLSRECRLRLARRTEGQHRAILARAGGLHSARANHLGEGSTGAVPRRLPPATRAVLVRGAGRGRNAASRGPSAWSCVVPCCRYTCGYTGGQCGLMRATCAIQAGISARGMAEWSMAVVLKPLNGRVPGSILLPPTSPRSVGRRSRLQATAGSRRDSAQSYPPPNSPPPFGRSETSSGIATCAFGARCG